MAREFKIPYGLNPHPSKYFRVVGDWLSSGKAMALQQNRDMTERYDFFFNDSTMDGLPTNDGLDHECKLVENTRFEIFQM